ncbi:hypothetical protein [Shimia sediminis]|nr:hypothetical protein [Shimia sediminis]
MRVSPLGYDLDIVYANVNRDLAPLLPFALAVLNCCAMKNGDS